MQITQLTPAYHVSPQISVEDVPAIAQAGFSMVICNRPDTEVPDSHQSAALEAAVKAAGMEFAYLPMTMETLGEDTITVQSELQAAATGPVLAYCRSGTRSSVLWALGKAGEMPTDEILETTAKAGYQLDQIRPGIESLASQKG
ncbi:TIGR01244 family protein [Salipiger pallidus]|uniref:TIGR01244 family protein n=1 Tax=Salipiger pallidus TaxID=1775170 RepID=A0A8J2ZM60_9RHOB|nr:TIGR01244 family sulfur transferase [Salipiger pallidus]GGG82008.1 TIGR01244 family protein [Salipiger pallidus]